MLHRIDNDEIEIASSGLQLEAKLFLKGGNDPGCRFHAWCRGICGSFKLRESKVEIEATDHNEKGATDYTDYTEGSN